MSLLGLLVLAVFLQLGGAHANAAGCGLPDIQIDYENEVDREIACEAFDHAINFFRNHGVEFDRPEVKIRFLESVYVPMVDQDGTVRDRARVYGAYFGDREEVDMSSWGTEYLLNRTIFETLPITAELHTSVVTHEITHRLLHVHYKKMGKEVERPTSEFFAYCAQVATMDPQTQGQVLALWEGAELPGELAINTMIWASAPHKYGVMSYRFCKNNPEVLQKILAGEFQSGDMMLGMM